MRSLITLKALTYAPTGGIVAAPTTSLPEQLGGVRNWDYRFCWLRDATFTLYALMIAGYTDEARAWREWLLRAVAGEPAQLQIMYGLAGERRLTELELRWLPGYEGSTPGADRQRGAASSSSSTSTARCMDALHLAPARSGSSPTRTPGACERRLLEFLETAWQRARRGDLGGARARAATSRTPR